VILGDASYKSTVSMGARGGKGVASDIFRNSARWEDHRRPSHFWYDNTCQ